MEHTTLNTNILTNEELTEAREELISTLSENTNGALDDVISSLLEVERALTLRESC
jgi:hypothetical protein